MTTEKKLRSVLHADVKSMCKEIATQLNVEFDQDASDLIGELTWKKLLLYAGDLEAFQKHAKRSVVNTDDVKLLCRRNSSLKEFIESECPSVSTSKPEAANNAGKRKKKPEVICLD